MSSKKRAKLDNESEDNGPVDSEEVSADEETGDEGEDDDLSVHSSMPSDMDDLQVNFQARCILKDDFHGVKRLLKQLFPKAPFNISALADLIAGRDNIGSVLKLSLESEEDEENGRSSSNEGAGTSTSNGLGEESKVNNEDTTAGEREEEEEEMEDEVLGVTSLVRLVPPEKGNSSSCSADLTQHLLRLVQDYCTDEGSRDVFSDILSNDEGAGGRSGTGIIVHERFLNIPMDIGPPMLENLIEEVTEYFKGEEPKYYVLVTRSHMEQEVSEEMAGTGERKRKRNKGKTKEIEEREKLVIEFEEIDCLYLERLASFSYPVSTELDTVQAGGWGYDDEPLTPYRTVFVLEREVLHKGVARLLDMFKVPTTDS